MQTLMTNNDGGGPATSAYSPSIAASASVALHVVAGLPGAATADTDDTVTESEQFSDQVTADNSSASENLPVRSTAQASGQPGVGGDDLSDCDQSDATDAGGFGFKEAFAQCKAHAQRLKDSDKASVTRRNDLLEGAALVVHHPDWTADSFFYFCKSRGLPCTRATLAKPYAAVIRAADRKIAPKVAHNYGTAVQHAIGEGCPPDGVAAFLAANGGVQTCVLAFRDAKKLARLADAAEQPADAEDKSVEAPKSRIVISGMPAGLDGLVTVTIAITKGKAVFVSQAAGAESTAREVLAGQ